MIQNKNTNVNTTFIVEPIDGQSLSACTALYTNFITPCFDDTIYFSDNISVFGNFSGTSVYATTFYSGGTNLLDIINGNDTYITGGTFNNNTDTLTLKRNDNVDINITGFTDYYISAFTYDNLNNLTLFANNTTLKTNISTFSGLTINGDLTVTGLSSLNQIIINNLTATTISATTYLNLPLDIYVTGGTYSNGTVTLINNTGGTFDVTGLTSDDTYVTGFTYDSNTLTIKQTQNQLDLSVLVDTMTGLTVTGVLSGNTIYGDGIGLFNIPISGITNLQSELNNKADLTSFNNHTGDTNNPHQTSFNNLISTAHTHSVSDITNLQSSLDNKLDKSGGTITNDLIINNGLTASTISATTYFNLPIDIRITGGTYSNSTGIATYTNNTGGTFNVNGFFKSSDDIFTTGLTFNPSNYDLTIVRNDNTSFTQNLAILASDMTITGGTYNVNTGVATFTNNTGGTFSVSGFLTGMTDTFTTGFTYSDNTLTIKRNANQPDLSVLVDTMSGLTVNGVLSATTISGGTFYGDGSNINYVQKRNEAILTTNNNTLTTIATITGLTSDTSRFIEVFITAHLDSNNYGYWKRTLAVNNVSGISTILFKNFDIDKQSTGLTSTSVVFSASSSDILIQVSGELSKTYNWIADWEIIKR